MTNLTAAYVIQRDLCQTGVGYSVRQETEWLGKQLLSDSSMRPELLISLEQIAKLLPQITGAVKGNTGDIVVR